MTTELRARTASGEVDATKLANSFGGHLVRSDSFNSLNGGSDHAENGVVEDHNDEAITSATVLRRSSRSLQEDQQDSQFYTYISPGVKADNSAPQENGDEGGFRLHIPSMYSKDSEQVAPETTTHTEVKPLDEQLPDVEEAQRRREMRRLSRGNSIGSRQSDESALKLTTSLSRKSSTDNKKESGSPTIGGRSGSKTAPKSPLDVKPQDAFKLSDDLEELEKEFKAEILKLAPKTPTQKPISHILSSEERRSSLAKTSSLGKQQNESALNGILGANDPSIMHALTGHVPFGDESYSRSTSMLEPREYSTPRSPALSSSLPQTNYLSTSPKPTPPSPKPSPSPSPSPLTTQTSFSLRSAATEFLKSDAPTTPTPNNNNRSTLDRSMSNISNWSDTESNCSTGSRVKDIADRFGGQSKSIRRQYSLASAPGFSLNKSSGGEDGKSQYGGSVKSVGGRMIRKAESMGGASISSVKYAADLENRLQGLMKPKQYVPPKQPLWMKSDRERRRKIASEARKKWNMSDYGQLTMPAPQPPMLDNDHNNLKFKKALQKFQVVEGSRVSDLEAQEARWKSVFEDKAAMFESFSRKGEKEIDVRNSVRRSLSNRSLLRQMSIESEKGLDDISIY